MEDLSKDSWQRFLDSYEPTPRNPNYTDLDIEYMDDPYDYDNPPFVDYSLLNDVYDMLYEPADSQEETITCRSGGSGVGTAHPNGIFITDPSKIDNLCIGIGKDELMHHQNVDGLKYYLAVMYLRIRIQPIGEVYFTLEDMSTSCGYPAKSRHNKVYDDFRNIIQSEILDRGYATTAQDIYTVKPSKLLRISIDPGQRLFIAPSGKPFVMFTYREFKTMTNSAGTVSIGPAVLTGVYLAIKSFLNMDDPTDRQICFPSLEQLSEMTGLNMNTVLQAVNILGLLRMIYKCETKFYVADLSRPGWYLPTPNVYAISDSVFNASTICTIMSMYYGRQVYPRDSVPGKISFPAT